MLLAAIEVPFIVLITIAMDKIGRRVPLVSFMIGAAVCCLISAFASHGTIKVAVSVLGKGCIAASFALIYFFTSEIYPTAVRSSGLGICSTIGRLGGFLAPYVVDMNFMGDNTPVAICGAIALVSGILALDLPETKGKKLPETINDVNCLIRNGGAKAKLVID